MVSFVDVCRFNATAAGTGSFVVSSAVLGYQTPAQANAANGKTYRYRAESADLTQWEVGFGVYTSGSVTLTRTVLFNSSGGTSAINFLAPPQVALTLLAEDLLGFATTVVTQVFLASGTYTPTAGMLYCNIECWGGGGGGAGCAASATGTTAGGGGGQGNYSRALKSAATIGASQVVTIGPGGGGGTGAANGSNGTDTSVGSLCIGKAGFGGNQTGAGSSGSGGIGGSAGTGDFTIPGIGGDNGVGATITTIVGIGGHGGGNYLSPVAISAAAANGGPALANSAQGGNGGATNSTVTTANGGAGGSGLVVITEFCGPV